MPAPTGKLVVLVLATLVEASNNLSAAPQKQLLTTPTLGSFAAMILLGLSAVSAIMLIIPRGRNKPKRPVLRLLATAVAIFSAVASGAFLLSSGTTAAVVSTPRGPTPPDRLTSPPPAPAIATGLPGLESYHSALLGLESNGSTRSSTISRDRDGAGSYLTELLSRAVPARLQPSWFRASYAARHRP